MAKLSTEQLAQLKLIAHTLKEMRTEVFEMSSGDTVEVESWLNYTRVKILKLLAIYGIVAVVDPPAPPNEEHPF